MKKILTLLLSVAMLLTLAACGGGEPDPNAGMYLGVSGEMSGITLTMEELFPGESYLELKDGGKADLVLEGDKIPGKWTLEGEDFNLVVEGEDCPGTLKDGVITFDFAGSGITLVFAKDGEIPAEKEAVKKEESSKAEAVDAITYNDAGYWEILRIDGPNAETSVSEEDMQMLKDYGMGMYLELLEDGTGFIYIDAEDPITWCDGTVTFDGVMDVPYTVENGELALDMEGSVMVFCKGEKPAPVISELEQAGFTEFIEDGIAYPYTTMCYEDESYDTVGDVTVTNYEIFDSAEGYEYKEGYEWRLVSMEAFFYDENAQNYGMSVTPRSEDYYNTQMHDDTKVELDESDDFYSYTFTAIHQGEEAEVYYRYVEYWGDWIDDTCTFYMEWAYQVPVGYDGIVVGVNNARVEEVEGTYITDYDPADFVLFRLYNKEYSEVTDMDAGTGGYYSLYAVDQDGEYTDYETISMLGMDLENYVILNDDGTGTVCMDGEEMACTYDEECIYDDEGNGVNYAFVDGLLELYLEGNMTFYYQAG